jgi:hypothetical protein
MYNMQNGIIWPIINRLDLLSNTSDRLNGDGMVGLGLPLRPPVPTPVGVKITIFYVFSTAELLRKHILYSSPSLQGGMGWVLLA